MKSTATDRNAAPASADVVPLTHALCHPRRQAPRRAAGLSDLCPVGVTLVGSAQGVLPIEECTMAEPADARHRRHAALRQAGTAVVWPVRDGYRNEALAREPEPARGRASKTLTLRGEKDDTHNLDR